MHRTRTHRGFTLLEVMIALAILAVSLVAIAAINAGALNMHAYSKRLTIATMLARSKMADLESELQSKGLPADDETKDGDFDDEGFPKYTWVAEIIRPKTEKISTDQLLSVMGMDSLLGGGGKGGSSGAAPNIPGLPPGATQAMGGQGQMLAGMMQGQLQGMLDQLGKSVREVRLTVSWPDGKQSESFTIVTHMVSLGPGTDQAVSTATPQLPGSVQGQGGIPGLPGQGLPGLPPGLVAPGRGGVPQLPAGVGGVMKNLGITIPGVSQ